MRRLTAAEKKRLGISPGAVRYTSNKVVRKNSPIISERQYRKQRNVEIYGKPLSKEKLTAEKKTGLQPTAAYQRRQHHIAEFRASVRMIVDAGLPRHGAEAVARYWDRGGHQAGFADMSDHDEEIFQEMWDEYPDIMAEFTSGKAAE